MFFVYIIKSQTDGRLYKGFTNNLERRLKEHNFGKNKTTAPYKPWILVYKETYQTRIEARDREKYFKSGAGREFLKQTLNL
ncbi:MAG TPA: GIY-YIG nuclease family protein [Bacteroidales bacterium]|nr:GIY-YIG nuclease family protein [Bacteroidales bacterium]